MVPVEAQACGRPVVALGEGGALESVVDGVTGVLVRDESVEAFADGARATCRLARFDPPRSAATPSASPRPLPARSSQHGRSEQTSGVRLPTAPSAGRP